MTIHKLEKLTVPEICEQIQDFTALLGQMVGNLYPRIIQGEIDILEELLEGEE